MRNLASKNIFECAKLHFKIASGAGVYPAEGVAVQIRLHDDSVAIFQDSNRRENGVLAIYEATRLVNPLAQKFTIEAVAFATELDTESGETFNPTKESVENLVKFLKDQKEEVSIFIVEGHSSDDLAIREYKLAL